MFKALFRLKIMHKLKNVVVDTSLSGKQLQEICISIGIKYYLPKSGCVERIKKRLEIVEKEDKLKETNRGKKRENSQPLSESNKKKKISRIVEKRITRAAAKQNEQADEEDEDVDEEEQADGDVDEEDDDDEKVEKERDYVENGVEDFDDTVNDATWEPVKGLEDLYKEEEILRYDDDSEKEDDQESLTSTNSSTKRLQPVYMQFKTVKNKEEAIDFLREEKVWSMNTKPKKTICKNSVNEFYRCNSSVKCPVKACVVYKSVDDQVNIKKTCNIEHNHNEIVKDSKGLNCDTKKAIQHLYTMGTKTALPIIYALRDKEVLSSIADIDIERIQEPTPLQVNNYLLNNLRPKIEEKSHFHYGELREWVMLDYGL